MGDFKKIFLNKGTKNKLRAKVRELGSSKPVEMGYQHFLCVYIWSTAKNRVGYEKDFKKYPSLKQ